MKPVYQLIFMLIIFCIKYSFAQPTTFDKAPLILINGISAENLILRKAEIENLDSLSIYSDDSIFTIESFRFTATFPGGISDWISNSNQLTPEMKDTLKFIKKFGFILFSEFIVKNQQNELVQPFFKYIEVQILE